MTKNTAAFYGNKGIRCNALMIGGMNTNITEAFMAGVNEEGKDKVVSIMGALRSPLCDIDEVAEVCVSMTCGKGSRLINGACIPIDHGFSGTVG